MRFFLEIQVVKDLILQFSNEQIEKTLTYLRDWNAYSKYSLISQVLLNILLKTIPPSRLESLPNIKKVFTSKTNKK